jgi:hypothetical protein
MIADQLWQIVKVGELGAENVEPINTEGEPGYKSSKRNFV